MVDGLEELLMAAFEYWVDDLTDVTWAEVQAAIDRQAEVLRREGWRRDTDESSRGERLRTEQDLEALPVGSVVKAHWADGSQEDYTVIRSDKGGAGSGSFGVMSGNDWIGIVWWGTEITLLYRAEG